MLRRGRSTSRPSSTLCTRDISVATCCRSPALSRSACGSTPRMTRWASATRLIELLVAADVQLAEPLEELGQVLDRRVAEDLGLAVVLAREPLGQVGDQLGQFGGERLLGQPHGLVETGLHPLALLLRRAAG